MIVKIAGTVLCELLLCALLKKYRPEFVLIAEIACTAVLFCFIADELRDTVSSFSGMLGNAGLEESCISVLCKAAAIALAARFISELCRDCGENALAVKTEFSGKILILACALPLLEDMIGMVTDMIGKI